MIQGWPWYALHFRENGLKWFFFLQNCTASSFSICNWKHLVIRSVFIPIPKKGNDKEYSSCCTIALISHTSKVMLKILQVHMNCELPNVQEGFKTCRETRDQTANIHWIIEKAREFQEKFDFCFIDYAKAFKCVDHNKLWKILQEVRIPDYLTCLLRNLYASQEATNRTRHRTIDWFQFGKGICQSCILSPWLFHLYAEYIMHKCQVGWSTSWNQDFREKYQ